jgi:glycosyltransferase involved in cell wall biosynthesis
VKNPISAFIITKNEEKLIEKAIQSVKNIVDEVIIVDSGSTDSTVQIAESLGCKVVYNNWPGYVQQKIFAESLCKHRWILNIDADEELSKELQDEINYIFQAGLQEKFKGYRLKLVIMLPEDVKPKFLAPTNTFIRLYNKEYVSFANSSNKSTTHDVASLKEGMSEKDNVLVLLSAAYHRSSISIKQLVEKINFYTTEQAHDLVNNNRKISKLRIGTEFFWWFLKAYFHRRYFVFGFKGFIYSVIFAFGKFLRLAKAYELKHDKISSL